MIINDINFIPFTEDVNGITLPHKFTFPFDYIPHEIAKVASIQLQQYLLSPKEWHHDFGLHSPNNENVMGKMFGVLVVKNTAGKLGFLQAFSGIIGKKTQLKGFVPPIFDRLKPGFAYSSKEKEIVLLNQTLGGLEKDPKYVALKTEHENFLASKETELLLLKKELKEAKKLRQTIRKEAKAKLNEKDYEILHQSHQIESRKLDFEYKKKHSSFLEAKQIFTEKLHPITEQINDLKALRKKKSAEAQQLIFDQYQFNNGKGEKTQIQNIFKNTPGKTPPSGAGDCAAPKLLQYAFINNYTPIALAEFWWGKSPKLEVRQHKKYYPACKAKCHPILSYMLQGLNVDTNPVLSYNPKDLTIETLFEDEFIVVINKPAHLLSVPGKTIKDSVQKRMQTKYLNATGPLTVHRLDMGTSGIMVIAKDLKSYHHLQNQFVERSVKKQYTAILNGVPAKTNPIINLPLRVDLNNRPHQVVCQEHGKNAETKWKLLEVKEEKSLVHFFPKTGRTHQLRVHASHPKGLNTPILGDELYGTRHTRLHLHASLIEFIHPNSNTRMVINCPAPFHL